MAFLTSQAVIPFFTNAPTDVMTNTMHWTTDGIGTPTAAGVIADRLEEFYLTCYQISNSAASYVNWDAAYVKVFDLSDPSPRVPIIIPIDLGAVGSAGSNIPTEVACVLSYYAAPESGTPGQRLKNRIYLGGLGLGAVTEGTSLAFPTIAPAFRVDVLDAAEQLHDYNGTGVDWVQRSSVGLITARPIVGAWVDNGPDTQRRRSVLATARSVRTF